MTRRFRRRLDRTWIFAVALLAAVAWKWASDLARESEPETLAEGPARVERVEQATLLLDNRAAVRLIGVRYSSAELVGAPDADSRVDAFIREFIATGSTGLGTVRLAFDRERLDRSGRFLAYVWVGDRTLNEELLRQGLAQRDLNQQISQSIGRRFRLAEKEARDARRGLWAKGK